jgi:hypothetical protein
MGEPEKTYQVRFLRYAYRHFDRFFPAQWVTWRMSAPTDKEALRRVKAKIRRGEQYRVLNPD